MPTSKVQPESETTLEKLGSPKIENSRQNFVTEGGDGSFSSRSTSNLTGNQMKNLHSSDEKVLTRKVPLSLKNIFGHILKSLNYLFFAYMRSFVNRASRRKERMHTHHLPEFAPTKENFTDVCVRLSNNFFYYQKKQPGCKLLLKAFNRFDCLFYVFATFKREITLAILLSIFLVCSRNLLNFLLGELLNGLLNQDQDKTFAIMLPFIVCQLISFFLDHHFYYFSSQLGLRIKLAVTNMLYEKLLLIDNSALRRENDAGKFINTVTNDLDVLDDSVAYIVGLVSAPIFLALSLFIMYSKIQASCLLGIIFMLLLFPLQKLTQNIKNKLNEKGKLITDKRLGLLSEFLENFKTVKMLVWEPFYEKKVGGLYKEEVKILRKVSLCESFNFSILSSSVYVALFIILTSASYLNIEKKVDDYVFTVLGLLLDYRTYVVGPFTFGIGALFDVNLVFSRIRDLMELSNKSSQAPLSKKSEDCIGSEQRIQVRLKNLCCSYTDLNKESQLHNVNIDISAAGLNLIIGPSGSGKTTLLKSILREVPFMQGVNNCVGRIAYVEQEPSLCDDTLQNNILFGLPLDKNKYEAVLKACCLDKDVKKISNGLLGMKGARLSGGQRARAALARALYSDADIYLMDDPLSAIDAKLTKAIFKNVFQTYLKGKMVFMVTHQVKYSKKANHIIVMFGGKVFAQGNLEILKKKRVDLFRCAMTGESKHANIALTQNFDFINRMSNFLNKEGEGQREIFSGCPNIPRNSVFSTIDQIFRMAENKLEKFNEKQRKSMIRFHRSKDRHKSLKPFGVNSAFKSQRQKPSIILQIPSYSAQKITTQQEPTLEFDKDPLNHFSKKALRKQCLDEHGASNSIGLRIGHPDKKSMFSINAFDSEENTSDDRNRDLLDSEIREVSDSKEISTVKSKFSSDLSQNSNIKEFNFQSSLKKKSPFFKEKEKKVSILVSNVTQPPLVNSIKKFSVISSMSRDTRDEDYEFENEFANQSVEMEEDALSCETSDSDRENAKEICHKCREGIEHSDVQDNSQDNFVISREAIRKTLMMNHLWLYLPFLMLFYFSAEFVSVFIFYNVSKMASDKINDFNTSDFFNLLLILISFYYLMIFAKAGLVFNFWTSISNRIHSSLLTQILIKKLSFFDSNSSGFLLNNFSADMNCLAFEIPRWMIEFLDNFFMISGYILTIVLFDWAVIVPALILFYPLLFTKAHVIPAINAAIKLESDYHFQLTNFFTDSIGNLTNIRVFAQEKYFLSRLFEHIKLGFNACSTQFTSNRYLAFWLDLYTNLFSIITIVIFIGLKKNQPEYLGIMIIYIINLCGNLQWTIRSQIETLNSLSSLQKIHTTLNQVDFNESKGLDKNSDPSELKFDPLGDIEFNNVTLRYNPNDLSKPPAVQDLSFIINKGERLGCVGKSGAGKSTIVLGLMKFIEGGLENTGSGSNAVKKPEILLDGINVQKLEPRLLRKVFGVMPQSPFLMSATVRENMDPFGEYSDESIWEALHKAKIKTVIQGFPNKLSQIVGNESNLLSTGQKQMLYVARVILKKAKIIIMDEATANIDIECDLQVQEVLSTELPSSTFITIAHRINTIIDYDKILVLDKGTQVEFGHPFKLLALGEEDEEITNHEGYFAQLIQALQEKDVVFKAAKQSFNGVDKLKIKKEVYQKLKEGILNSDSQIEQKEDKGIL